MKRILFLIAIFIFAAIPSALSFNIKSETKLTRSQFAKLLRFDKPVSRPKDPIRLAEAAVLLSKSFRLNIDFSQKSGTDPWYKPYIIALEGKNAIPISFWTPDDFIKQSEADEMTERLGKNDYSAPSLTFEYLEGQKKQNPYRSTEFLRFAGDFSEPIKDRILTPKILRLFKDPGTYNIFDVDYDSENADTNYCRRFYTQSGVRGNVTVVYEDAKSATVIIKALSTDYCVFPFHEMNEGECPSDVLYGDDPRCNIGKAKEYEITLEQKGDEFFVKGAQSNRIRITRAPIEPICRAFAPDCPAGYYYPTKVETSGKLSAATTPNGAVWNVYRTSWKPIFTDLRGVPFIAFEKKLENGAIWKRLYEAPEHNRDAWGHGIASYDDCILGYDFDFCIKREGNSFVTASREELGNKAALWIDENYRR